jgi:hypothetical protein
MNKFQELYEGTFTRFQGGGFLTGDLVKLSPSILKSPWASKLGGNYLEQLRRFLESDLNIRVSVVKTLRPGTQGSFQQDMGAGNEYYADICLEEVPGKFLDFTEVPCEFLEMLDTGVNLSPIADSQKRESDINIKPEPVNAESSDDPYDPVTSTKTREGDKSTPMSNTVLPGATGADSYTSGYML